jgi:type VI protein secretion system component Hcp
MPIAIRDVTTSVPGLSGSTVLMSIEGIDGNCMIPEYSRWMPLSGFEWGGTRTIARQADRAGRTHAIAVAPQMRAVQVVRASDFRSPQIWELMLSTTRKPVDFVWLRTSGDGTTAYMKLSLASTLVTRMSEHSGGDVPQEEIAFSYEAVELTVINVGNRLRGPQDVVSYRLPDAMRG